MPASTPAAICLAVFALSACTLPIAECFFRCEVARCEVGVCGADGYCHRDTDTNHCAAMTDGGTEDGSVPGGPFNVAFVTSKKYAPGAAYIAGGTSFASLEDAARICNDLAAQSTVLPQGRHYVAWLSTSTVDARDRLVQPGTSTPARGWLRPDGRPFGDAVTDFTDGKIFYPLRLDELGRDVGGEAVATGTDSSGTHAASTAQDWTSQSAVYASGDAAGTTGCWSASNNSPGMTSARLYCFGVDFANPVTPKPASGRIAFVSHDPYRPMSGISAADAQCMSEAVAAGLSGTYRALLATASASAASRFSSGETWVRTDGVPWLTSADDLERADLLTSLNVDSLGIYQGAVSVWSGADRPSDFATQSCSDWTQLSGSAVISRACRSSTSFFAYTTGFSCATTGVRLYCLQD